MAAQESVPALLAHDGTLALSLMKASEPAAWLAPPPELLQSVKTASEFLFALSSAYSVNCPLKQLLTQQFDAEQIWQQIDLQTAPLVSSLKRRLKQIERSAPSAVLIEGHAIADHRRPDSTSNGDAIAVPSASEEAEDNETEPDEDAGDGTSSFSGGEEDLAMPRNDDGGEGEKHAIEDRFLRLSDMERFLDEGEASQDGAAAPLGDESDFSESEDGDMQEDGGPADIENDLESEGEDIKYDDFFGIRGKGKSVDNANGFRDMHSDVCQVDSMTTHEKQRTKMQKRIEQLEKANLDPKSWTLQGEVSALKRPKNSALEVELDFEHNVRPPPVITEEITASLEDIIRNRIAENNFDDVQRKPTSISPAPKERIELDENKSKKGLGELYETDYLQQTGLAPISISPADEVRREATHLFKALCVKLDALSHFHFTPKPVIEDMAIRSDVPALVMEEVAPLMTSDARMLAPEEVFTGEGVVKAEAELTREEKKRRRARQKKKSKVEKKRKESDKKSGINIDHLGKSIKPTSQGKQNNQQSQFAKSKKVFQQLDQSKHKGKEPNQSKDSHVLPFLKL